MNRFILLALHMLSFVLLGFGWTLDMLHIDISTHVFIDLNLFNEKRSVLGTIQTLWESANYFPFSLIFLFGILIPLFKSGIMFYLLLKKAPGLKWYRFVSAISKWAMADVFVISIFVAFLGANTMESTTATIEPGFYFFASYVIISGIISYLLGKMIQKQAGSTAE